MRRSIRLIYLDGLHIPEKPDTLQLPRVIHMRAARVLTSITNADGSGCMLLRSEYDALYDIQLELKVEGDIGYVQAVDFIDAVEGL